MIAGRKFKLPQECQEPAVRAKRRSTRVRIHIAVLLILYTVWVGFQIVASLINAFRTSNDAFARKRPFPCWRYLQISAMSYRAPAPGCACFAVPLIMQHHIPTTCTCSCPTSVSLSATCASSLQVILCGLTQQLAGKACSWACCWYHACWDSCWRLLQQPASWDGCCSSRMSLLSTV